MKIVCNKSDLVKGVNIVSKAVPGKTTMPILECILIDATTDIIKLTANDMELGIQTEIAGEIMITDNVSESVIKESRVSMAVQEVTC